jgi:hypothetical protein
LKNVHKEKIDFVILLFCFFCLVISAQSQQPEIPDDCSKILKTKFSGWKLAIIPDGITNYYKTERSFEQPNFIKGDWNGDEKIDYAVLLENKKDFEKRIILALIKTEIGFKDYILEEVGYDCLMSQNKKTKAYNFETKKNFTFKNDAIFGYFWEKEGSSYIWEDGKFISITTSD